MWLSPRPRCCCLGDGPFFGGSAPIAYDAVLRGLWVAGLFHPLLCSFCCFTALFPKGAILLWITFCMFCSKKLLPLVIKSDSWATWGKPCLWRLIVSSSRQDRSCLALLEISESWPTMPRARSAMQEKKSIVRWGENATWMILGLVTI